MRLKAMTQTLAVCRLSPEAPMPDWLTRGWHSVTRTAEELSVVCEADLVPSGIEQESPWRGFQVAGPIAFSEIGVLASICQPLAAANISIFAISTFDTDYLLVKSADFSRATEALKLAGHQVLSGGT